MGTIRRHRLGQNEENAITGYFEGLILFLLILFGMYFLCMAVKVQKIPPPFEVPQQQLRPPGFDYFLLALQWPNAFCNIHPICTRRRPTPQQFTVHGLWPQFNNDEYPVDCSFDIPDGVTLDNILQGLRANLRRYWPNLCSDYNKVDEPLQSWESSFWLSQWKRHGTCSSNAFSPEQYFKTAIDLARRYAGPIGSRLSDAGINSDGTTQHSYIDILKAVKAETGHDAKLHFQFNGTGHRLLKEIRLCVKSDGVTLFDCNGSIFASRWPPSLIA